MLRALHYLTDHDVQRLEGWPEVDGRLGNRREQFRLRSALQSVAVDVMAICPPCEERENALRSLESALESAFTAVRGK